MVQPYALGYVVVETARAAVDDWMEFGTELLGLMPNEQSPDGVLRFRMDERCNRIAVTPGATESVTLGWEYRDEASWTAAVTALQDHGTKIEPVDEGQLAIRGAKAAYSFTDPAGCRGEVFYGGHIVPVVPFVSPTGTRFVTGDGGLGHAAVICGNLAETTEFYQHVLGMHLRETTLSNLAFLGTNSRQHSIALLGVLPHDAPAQLMHIMLEVDDLDVVGRAQDRCLEGRAPLKITLGKHWNDHMISFYAESPSGFDIEYGFGGRRVDQAEWTQVHQEGVVGASYWGHRVVLPDGSLGHNVGNAL
jgi:3,4-dihydroxy-9,10-secoandrosta-1,3,5(10)-triene-9,17-dione 4,5-dioxygenase